MIRLSASTAVPTAVLRAAAIRQSKFLTRTNNSQCLAIVLIIVRFISRPGNLSMLSVRPVTKIIPSSSDWLRVIGELASIHPRLVSWMSSIMRSTLFSSNTFSSSERRCFASSFTREIFVLEISNQLTSSYHIIFYGDYTENTTPLFLFNSFSKLFYS